jgi:hypothetical protein
MPPSENTGPPPVAWIELPDQGTVTLDGDCHIGRIEGNEIVNPDSRISRRHAVIQRQGERFVLVDLGSTIGTFLNDARIFTARKLKHGDVILVGSLRYVFRQPSLTAVSGVADSAQHTVVAVGKSSCWMMLVAPGAPANSATAAWAEKVRQVLAGSGAGVKRTEGAAFLAHWREHLVTPEKIGAVLQEIAGLAAPPAARVTLHHGSVRVGPAAAAGEESLLGAEVTVTHKLAATAATLPVVILVSEAAAKALGPAAPVSPLSAQTIRAAPDSPPLFTVVPR